MDFFPRLMRYTAQASFYQKSREESASMSVKAVEEMPAAVSSDDFHTLEERIYRTIDLLKAAREAKTAAERTAARLREQLEAREGETDSLRAEVVALRREREEVRTRVEKMLHQIEALSVEESAG